MKSCGFDSVSGFHSYPIGKVLLAFLLVVGPLSACGGNKHLAKHPHRQHYVDFTRKALPKIPRSVTHAEFARVNRDPHRDLVFLVSDGDGRQKILVLFGDGKGKFTLRDSGQKIAEKDEKIIFFSLGDLDGDRAEDLITVQTVQGKTTARILFNNKKGYFYKKEPYSMPLIRSGMERVELIDIDQDRDLDLFFTGRDVKNLNGNSNKRQAQLHINNGKGEFQDQTRVLWPPVPPGIVAASFADYDGDQVRDAFLVYGNGQNRMLLNNSLGKFTDVTRSALPAIKDQSTHADWADFDGDGDNDLLVVNRSMDEKYRSLPGETTYFLENDGRGKFKKKSHKYFPTRPAHRVYLLDANGNGIADVLILGQDGVHFMHGGGKWRFSVETDRRLPRFKKYREMAFGDADGDGFLDLIAIDASGRARLWINRVD